MDTRAGPEQWLFAWPCTGFTSGQGDGTVPARGGAASGPPNKGLAPVNDREGGLQLGPPRNQCPPSPRHACPSCPAAVPPPRVETFLCHAFRALSGPHGLQLIIDSGKVCRRAPVGVGRGHIAWGV